VINQHNKFLIDLKWERTPKSQKRKKKGNTVLILQTALILSIKTKKQRKTQKRE